MTTEMLVEILLYVKSHKKVLAYLSCQDYSVKIQPQPPLFFKLLITDISINCIYICLKYRSYKL